MSNVIHSIVCCCLQHIDAAWSSHRWPFEHSFLHRFFLRELEMFPGLACEFSIVTYSVRRFLGGWAGGWGCSWCWSTTCGAATTYNNTIFIYKKSYHVRCRSDLTPFPILVMHQIQYHVPELFLHFKRVGHITSINVRWHSSDQHTKSLTIIAG